MPKKRIPSSCWALVMCLSAAAPAAAMGFGASTPAATLGQPLDFSVGLRLDAGESLEPDCVSAEVSIGDVTLPVAGVGASLVTDAAGNRSIRVRTLARIDEPVVAVQVAAGCPQRLVRRFVVFADPPVVGAAPVVAAPVVTDTVPTPPSPAATPPVAAVALAPPTNTGLVPAAPPKATASAPPRRVAPPRPRPAAVVAAAPAARPRLKLDAAPPPPPAPPSAAASAPLPAPVMDLVEQANQAVLAAIAAASASQGRIAALEASMRQLSDEAQAQKAMVDTLRDRAAAAEGRNQWVLPLGLALLALLALAGWLWMRLRELERDRRHGWLSAARAPAPPPAPAPAVPPSPSQVPLLVERSVRTTGVAALGAGLAPVHVPTPSELPDPPSTAPPDWAPETATLKTQPLVPSAALAQPESRDVSAEELIDLEQQAEFFVVLGQDDAAIDLLVSHLRDSGGASPLPYLKLLDIYRRLGDRDAYERTRDRFNHRFNAHVPGWDAPAGDGRTLEDYPHVMGWLQHVWPKPLDAMAELESLLFRKDGGELFELPAYRELLMLYALARDLLDGDTGHAGTAVDVLLPLNDTPGFAPTSPRPYFGDDGLAPPEHQPTAPIDLDLDLPAEPPPPSPYGRYR